MSWRPHTEPPARIPTTALLARQDKEGDYFLLGIYMQTAHRPGLWMLEDSNDEIVAPEPYWWLPEAELLAPFTVGTKA